MGWFGLSKWGVPGTGLEPARHKTLDPKSSASTSFATPAEGWKESKAQLRKSLNRNFRVVVIDQLAARRGSITRRS